MGEEMSMNEDFPRIITLLRKEKGISQKQAASDLGISQALLSHYEKGIRECGLDFLVRVAKYYNVSCDYLVGITPNRNGEELKLDDVSAESEASQPVDDSYSHIAILPSLNKKLIINSMCIIFDILAQTGSKNLTNDVSLYLMVSVYKMFRLLYSKNPQNSQEMFAVSEELNKGLSTALMFVAETNSELDLKVLLSAKGSKNRNMELSPKIIQDKYPQYSAALANLIQLTERHMKSLQ